MSKRLVLLMCLAVLCGGVVLAACGGDDDDGGASTGQTDGAKAIDVSTMESAKGNVTVCMGKDTGGDVTAAIKSFNALKNGVTVKILEFSTSADEQRQQFVQRQEAKSGECDVFSSDVIWTAEFASQKWLYDLTAYVDCAPGRAHRGDRSPPSSSTARSGACRSRPTPASSTTAPTRSPTSRRPGRRSTHRPTRRTGSSTRARPTRA